MGHAEVMLGGVADEFTFVFFILDSTSRFKCNFKLISNLSLVFSYNLSILHTNKLQQANTKVGYLFILFTWISTKKCNAHTLFILIKYSCLIYFKRR
jgi:hypothetical protein